MAEAIKKSRIVSETDENLEESLLEEFNLRLKKCMSREDLAENEDAHIYENMEVIKTNGVTPTNHYDTPQVTNTFLKNERDHCEIKDEYDKSLKLEINGLKTDNDIEDKHTTKPSLNLPTTCLIELPSPTDTSESSNDPNTAKNRMLLSTDDTSCLLFTQTVTSPMLTPSEESIDFLKGFRQESNQTVDSSSDSAKTDPSETKHENGIQETPEHIYENVETLNEQHTELPDLKEVTAKFIENEGYHINKVIENSEVLTDQDEANVIIVTDLDENSVNPAELPHTNHQIITENNKDIIENKEVIEEKNIIVENGTEHISNVLTLKSQLLTENSTNDLKSSIRTETSEELDELKSLNIIKQIAKFESNTQSELQESTNTCVTTNVCVSTISESHFVQQTTTEMHTTDDKSLKKKKTKKIKNHHEKENISVNGTNTNNGEEESFYNVNVKNLCRSFGDLTKIDGEQNRNRKTTERNKSSFSKFDALQKKNVLNNQTNEHEMGDCCKGCGKPVFQMERIVAERCMWHRNCFRCRECSKQLLVDNFESHEGNLYCKPHFKALFAPKIIDDEHPTSDKPDLGLEELHSLNVKERFEVFENAQTTNINSQFEKSPIKMERSQSILSKLARFQAKGMDIGVTNESLNGVPIDLSESEDEEEEQHNEQEIVDGEDADLVRAKRVQKEKPFHFVQMSDVKSKWEQGNQQSRDDRREERKQEIQTIRSRLFLGKQGKMKEAYQQAIAESESFSNIKREVPVEPTEAAKMIKDKFEKGEVIKNDLRNKETEDMSVFESAISKNSRSLFQELDANGGKAPKVTSPTPPKLGNSVRNARESTTPEKEIPLNTDIVRSDEIVEDSVVAKATHTTTKMLSKFRQMEENLSKVNEPLGLKPLKRFTPPREPVRRESSSEHESGSEELDSEEEVDHGRIPEQDLIEAQKAARAKKLRAKFEHWEEGEIKRDSGINLADEIGEDQSQVETARSLRAKFESLRETTTSQAHSQRVKVNRFV